MLISNTHFLLFPMKRCPEHEDIVSIYSHGLGLQLSQLHISCLTPQQAAALNL